MRQKGDNAGRSEGVVARGFTLDKMPGGVYVGKDVNDLVDKSFI
jgi:hypothetical protein